MKLLSFKLLLSLLFPFLFVRPVFAQSFTDPIFYQITPEIPADFIETGATFFTTEFDLNYKEGPVIYSASPDGSPLAMPLVDDGATLLITKPDGTVGTFEQTYHANCYLRQQRVPEDISYLFSKGINNVKVSLYDICGGYKYSTPLYLTTEKADPIPSGPQPFLDLPWDYSTNGMSFNEAATSINSYFDHEYPLLSTGLVESPSSLNDLLNYEGVKDDRFPYSSHDGYDYGNDAKTKLNTPVLAPANGEATFMSSCGACGNAILINHKNGFQTRYYHLQPDELVVNEVDKTVPVTKGQQIGKVGYTGHVDPKGEAGSHIHFMVIQDKNNDGNFEDNIPDGLTDPFGWQSTDPDPWENYSFNYKGEDRTGNKSYYLFTKKLDNLNATLTANAAVFNIGKTKLEFPQGSTDQNLNLVAKSEPSFTNGILNSLGSIINIIAKNPAGNPVTNFLTNFILTIDFSQFDLDRYNLDTLSIYSSTDGENWTKETTNLDFNTKTASASLNHLTYFALMAERKDSIAPMTTPILEGEKGTDNNFRSDVKVTFNALDNEGGLGIEFTAYSIGESMAQPYAAPLSFTDEGSYKVNFYSQDKDGNIEEVKTAEFSIDKTIPEAKIAVDQLDWDLKVTPIASDSAQIVKIPGSKNKATYNITDPAGNTLSLETYDLDTKYIDVFKLLSLQYNSQPKIPLPDNLLDTNYLFYTPKKRPEIKIINQNFALKDKALFVIAADALKNKTSLNILENGVRRKEEKPGINLLKLQTNQGQLEYSY